MQSISSSFREVQEFLRSTVRISCKKILQTILKSIHKRNYLQSFPFLTMLLRKKKWFDFCTSSQQVSYLCLRPFDCTEIREVSFFRVSIYLRSMLHPFVLLDTGSNEMLGLLLGGRCEIDKGGIRNE